VTEAGSGSWGEGDRVEGRVGKEWRRRFGEGGRVREVKSSHSHEFIFPLKRIKREMS
jgi:hypothetical protein